MKLYVHIPSYLENYERIEDVIDANFGKSADYVEYTNDVSEFADYAKNDEYQALMVVIDGSREAVFTSLQLLEKISLKGPVIALYQNKTTSTLFNLANLGVVSAFEFNPEELGKGTLRSFVKSAMLGFLGRSSVEEFGPLEIDFSLKQVRVNGEDVRLTGKELSMFETLVKHKGSVRTKEQLVSAMYGVVDEIPDMKIIDVFICKIRDKLNKKMPGLGDSIETVWGRGYTFNHKTSVENKNTKKFGELHIDLDNSQVFIEGNPVGLTVTEYMIMRRFALNYPEQVSLEELVTEAGKFGRAADADTVSRAIYTMGRKLEAYSPQYRSIISDIRGSNMFTLNLMGIDESAARKIKYDIVQMPPFALNRTLGRAYLKNQDMDLTEKEYDLLNAMMEGFPNYVTLEDLLRRVYGEEERTTATINQVMMKLRAKIKEANGGEDIILSRRNIGYKLDIRSKRVLSSVADKRDTREIGPWGVDIGNYEITYKPLSMDDEAPGELLTLPRKQFELMSALLASYPKAMKREELGQAVYGDGDIEGNKLDILFSLLKKSISAQIQNFEGGLRKVGQDQFRIDMDYDNIPSHILEACDVEEVGPWGINRTLNIVLFDGDPVSLSDKECDLMDMFIQEYPQALSTTVLADAVTNGNKGSLNTLLTSIRKKFVEADVLDDVLINRRGVGYYLNVNLEELSEEQQNSFRVSEVGAYTLNHNTGAFTLGEGNPQIELNGSELAVVEVLLEASEPLFLEDIKQSVADKGFDFDAMHVRQCLYGIMRKAEAEGVEDLDLYSGKASIGFYLSCKEEEIRENSSFTTVGSVRINDTLRELSVHKTTIKLQDSEYTLVKALAANPSVPLSNEDISRLSEEDGKKFSESTFNLTKGKIVKKLEEAGLYEKFLDIFGHQSGVGHYFKSMENELEKTRLNGKRETSVESGEVVVQCGALSINTITDQVSYEDMPIPTVKGKPVDLLVLLAKRHGTMVTWKEMADHFFKDSSDAKIEQVKRGVLGLRHMINREMPELGNSIIRDIGDVGCALVFDAEEYASVYHDVREQGLISGGNKKPKPSKKKASAAPAQKSAAAQESNGGNVVDVETRRGAKEQDNGVDGTAYTGRKSFADRYTGFGS